MADGHPFDDIRALVSAMPAGHAEARSAALSIITAFKGPQNPLGRLDDTLGWLATWQGVAQPQISRPLIAVFAGTHRVAETVIAGDIIKGAKARVQSLTDGAAGVRGMAASMQAAFKVYEMGLDYPSADITQEASLSERDCAAAIAFGLEVVAEGADIIALGNAGYGAATAAAAIVLGLYGGSAEYWAGGNDGVATRRITSVQAAYDRHRDALSDPLEVLRRFGGRDVAGAVGAILAARHQSIPIVLDGFVSCAAAAILHEIDPRAIDHCLAGHVSAEPGHGALLDRLGLTPLHDLKIGLGDGTGAALALGTLRQACAAHQSLTF